MCIEVWDYFKENIKDCCKDKNKVKYKVTKDLEKKYFFRKETKKGKKKNITEIKTGVLVLKLKIL